MADRENKVTVSEVVSSVVRYTNLNDESRIFNISADVTIQDGKTTNFNSGVIVKRDDNSNGSANFGASRDFHYFSFTSNNLKEDELIEAVKESLSFISYVQESVESSIDTK